MRSLLIAITRNSLSLAGAALATFSIAIVATLFLLELVGFDAGPYIGILAYLIFPALLAVGLLLIPIGIRRHRSQTANQEEVPSFPVFDLNNDRTRRAVLLVLALSVVNVMIFAVVTYKGVEVMESNAFCGGACHSVMQPEAAAYHASPHAEVDCVECHIGSGADWFARSKISGAWQVVSVAFDLYDRPIPTPVHGLRPANETCGECHSATRFVGDTLTILRRHDDDEANTPIATVLNMHVGGRVGDVSRGIHWHADPAVEIQYRSDPKRETIYDVVTRRADGTSTTYLSAEPPDEEGELEWRTMDCVDCHNRPAHSFRLPEAEVDALLATRELESLPYFRREAIELLASESLDREVAAVEIPARLQAFYKEHYPETLQTDPGELRRAGRLLTEIYLRSVFPEMNITWGTYADHSGHESAPGCYRCHDDEHESGDGSRISQDCDLCHEVLAWDEESPEILEVLGD